MQGLFKLAAALLGLPALLAIKLKLQSESKNKICMLPISLAAFINKDKSLYLWNFLMYTFDTYIFL